MTIGGRIKSAREQNGISQVNLANMVMISKQTLYKYENDIITNIPSDKIEAIASALNVTPAYLMGWEEEVMPSTPIPPSNSNTIVIVGRSGTRIERTLTDDQIDLLERMIEQMPEPPKDL